MQVRIGSNRTIFVKPCVEHEMSPLEIELRDADGFRKVIYGCCNCHQLFDADDIGNELRKSGT